MDKRNGTTVPLANPGKRLRASGTEKRAAVLAEVTDTLRRLPAEVAEDLLERFARDVQRARQYWE